MPLQLRLFTMIRSPWGPIPCWILARTSSLVTWSLYKMRSILRYHLNSTACILLWSFAVRVHDSRAYKNMDVTRERISRILELREILLSFQTGFNLRTLFEKYLQHQQDLHHVFIDFKKSFDGVWHAALWATMKKYNISINLI